MFGSGREDGVVVGWLVRMVSSITSGIGVGVRVVFLVLLITTTIVDVVEVSSD